MVQYAKMLEKIRISGCNLGLSKFLHIFSQKSWFSQLFLCLNLKISLQKKKNNSN